MRAVIDNCVLLSALMSRSPKASPGRIFGRVQRGEVTVVISHHLLAELEHSLNYPKVRKRVSKEEGEAFLLALRSYGEMAPDTSEPAPVTRDRQDDYLVALATAEGARLVSSDKDVLHADLDPPALSPYEFLQLLGNERERGDARSQTRRMLRFQGLDAPAPSAVGTQPVVTPAAAPSRQIRAATPLASHRTVGVAPRSMRQPPGRTLTSFTRRAA